MVTRKEQRNVLVLRRYYIKQDYAPKGLHKGDIVLIVRNDQGKEHEVILRRNKAHSCSCIAGKNGNKKCYHREHCIAIENTRFDAKKAAKAKQSAMSEGLYTKLAALNEAKPAKVVELRSTLNGAQQSASFWSGLPSRAIAS